MEDKTLTERHLTEVREKLNRLTHALDDLNVGIAKGFARSLVQSVALYESRTLFDKQATPTSQWATCIHCREDFDPAILAELRTCPFTAGGYHDYEGSP